MKPKSTIFAVLFVVFLLTFFLYFFRIGADHNAQLINFVYVFIPLFSIVGGLYVVGEYTLTNPHGKAAAYITAGLVMWFIGEVIYYIYAFIFHISPYPSISDSAYILGYPFLLKGFLMELKIAKTNWANINRGVVMLVGIATFVLAGLVVYFGEYIAYDPSSSLLENSIKIAYTAGDILLLVPAIFLLKLGIDYKGGKLFSAWLAIFFAVFATLWGDILFAVYTTPYELSIWPYTLIDLLWIFSYLMFAYGFFTTAFSLRDIHEKLLKSLKK